MSAPATTTMIDAAEVTLGVTFPDSFRELLLRHNGGVVSLLGLEWDMTPVHNSSDSNGAVRTQFDIVQATAEARTWPGFPKHGVSIGCDGFGNHLVLLRGHGESHKLGSALHVWWHAVETLGGSSEIFYQRYCVPHGILRGAPNCKRTTDLGIPSSRSASNYGPAPRLVAYRRPLRSGTVDAKYVDGRTWLASLRCNRSEAPIYDT